MIQRGGLSISSALTKPQPFQHMKSKKRKKHTRMSTEWTPPNPAASPQEIEAAKSANGGYDATSLRKLGVPWPPPPSWRSRLLRAWKEQNPGESTEGLTHAFVKSNSPCPKNSSKIHPWAETTTEKNKVRVFRCTKCGARTTKPRAKTL